MGVSIVEGAKMERIANAMEIMAIAQAGGIDNEIGFDGMVRLIGSGLGKRVAPVGTPFNINKETGVSVSFTGSSITNVTVNEEVFINAEHEAGVAAYEFVFDGNAWHKAEGEVVELALYGIVVTGTPAVDDTIVIHETASVIPSSTLDHDYDTPVDPTVKHTMTIGMNNCFEDRQFDAPEALIACPEGLTVGQQYYITCLNAAYNGSTTEDGDFGFVPGDYAANVRYIRHNAMGGYRSTYSKATVLAGKFIFYGADFAELGQVETIEVSGESRGTSLGTTTACDPTKIVGEHVNFTQRNAYGSNDYETSNIRQYLNSVGTGWWRQQTQFDFPPASVATLKGLLTGVDPKLRAHMKTVKKRYAKSISDGYGYADVEDKVFLLSQTEVNLGTNNNIYETSLGMNNTLKTVPYAFYTGAVNADRIKLKNGSPRYWWLRGTYPSYGYNVRYVNTSGALSDSNAHISIGLVAACVIGE